MLCGGWEWPYQTMIDGTPAAEFAETATGDRPCHAGTVPVIGGQSPYSATLGLEFDHDAAQRQLAHVLHHMNHRRIERDAVGNDVAHQLGLAVRPLCRRVLLSCTTTR